jgi:hypothetical protein
LRSIFSLTSCSCRLLYMHFRHFLTWTVTAGCCHLRLRFSEENAAGRCCSTGTSCHELWQYD